MIGFDAHVDQCMFGLRLLNDSNEMLPDQKPTNFRVTSESLQKLMEKKCDGKHRHTHLEGHIPGVGLRSWFAESYPQALATHMVNCIQRELSHYDYILAAEEVPESIGGVNTQSSPAPAPSSGKALYDSVHRETIQQATDKRVAIEGLVIKDLLWDLKCQWRWVGSERQLSDGLTKVGARQSFVERYKGGYMLSQQQSPRARSSVQRQSRRRERLDQRLQIPSWPW